MSSFKDLGVFVHNNPDAEAAAVLNNKTARNSFALLPQGYCDRKTSKS